MLTSEGWGRAFSGDWFADDGNSRSLRYGRVMWLLGISECWIP
jgi:hypothetical protein